MNLKLDQIRRDDSAQPRAMLNTDHIKDLSDALEDGGDLTPVDVFYDGFSYWLADGFHRYSAYHRAKRDEIPVTVHQGDLRAAVLYSITVNAKHATLKLTREEKRAGVARLLKDEEWGQWSDREIGRRAGVAHPTVGAIRKELTVQLDSDDLTGKSSSELNERAYTTKHGTPAKMQTSNIGKSKADPPEKVTPPSDLPAPAAPPAVVSEPAPRHLKTYSPPPLPDPVEDDDLPPEEVDEAEDAELEPYRPPYVKLPSPDIRVRQPDGSRRRPFERAFTAVGAINSLSQDVIVEALNSVENKTPEEGALELEITEAIKKLERCMALAEAERKTVTV